MYMFWILNFGHAQRRRLRRVLWFVWYSIFVIWNFPDKSGFIESLRSNRHARVRVSVNIRVQRARLWSTPEGWLRVMTYKIVFCVQVSGVSNRMWSAMSASLVKWIRLDRCRFSSSRRHTTETALVFPHLCYLLEWISGFCMKLKPETRNLKPKTVLI